MPILFVVFSIVFFSCSDNSETETVIFPSDTLNYHLFPNDVAANDSAAAYLATGIILVVHPNGSYELSFDIDKNFEAPVLQLFRLYEDPNGVYEGYRYAKVMSIKPKERNGRYVYSFICEENKQSLWVTSLVDGDKTFKGQTQNVKLIGDGIYSDHFSINLIATGEISLIENALSVEDFAKILLSEFRRNFTSVQIDTINVRYANEHPTLGKKYPKDEPWLAGLSSEDLFLTELGGWPEKGLENALDIILVYRIEDGNVLGYSGLFSSNLGEGENSTVIIGTHLLLSSGKEADLSVNEIVNTAIHEVGHFFGLRHTTATTSDIEASADASNIEDGFEDTPYCADLRASGLYKKIEKEYKRHSKGPWIICESVSLPPSQIYFDVSKCPDAHYMMFPISFNYDNKSFSKEELAFLKKSLMLIPH